MGITQIMESNNERMKDFQKSFACLNRQLMLAHNLATGKERFYWYSAFVSLAIPALTLRSFYTKNPAIFAPVFIFSFSWAYQYDLFFGDKLIRIKKEAERILRDQPELIYPANNNNLWTEEEIDKIYKSDEKKA